MTADRDDIASHRVAEKAGFRREGVMRSSSRTPMAIAATLGDDLRLIGNREPRPGA